MNPIDLKKLSVVGINILEHIANKAKVDIDLFIKFDVKRIIFNDYDMRPQDLFICPNVLHCNKYSNLQYIEKAIKHQVSIIVTDIKIPITEINKLKKISNQKSVILQIKNARLLNTQIANIIYKTQPSNIIGITGTNGKTSVANFLYQIWNLYGLQSLCIGTLRTQSSKKIEFPRVNQTSPEPYGLHHILHKANSNEITHAVLEVSSHGIDQHRMDKVNFTVAAFTNLSNEHLDYHKNIDEYFQVKSKLFDQLLPCEKSAILNIDDDRFDLLNKICQKRKIKVITYGEDINADLCLLDYKGSENQAHGTIQIANQEYNFTTSIVGKFQILNALCAIALARESSSVAYSDAINLFPQLTSIPGRFELIGKTAKGGWVIVDFAHTPDALEKVLITAKNHYQGKIGVVFGCGGNRDISKRPVMGEIANDNSDWQIITDDNPRQESPKAIRSSILQHCPNGLEISNRYRAIKVALNKLEKDDLCIICGKGHEKKQIIGEQYFNHDDRKIVKEYLMKYDGDIF